MWNGIGWYGFIGGITTSTTDISLNVKLQLYAKGLVWSRGGGGGGGGGGHIFIMLNSQNRVFSPYFSIGTCPMRKRLLWISRGFNPLYFS